jgi:hypothetical protein
MRLHWLADVLRGAGLTVEELPGWKGRGKPLRVVYGIVEHGFGARYEDGWTDAAFDRVLEKGRVDLPGPLAQLGLDRDGHWVCVADGRANHNGYGTWGNDSIGVEAYGRDAWTPAQYRSWTIGTAAICRHLGWPVQLVKAHRETDPGRKPDPINVNMVAFRDEVRHLLAPPSPPPRPRKETPVFAFRDPRDNKVWIVENGERRHVQTPELDAYIAAKVVEPRTVINAITAQQADVFLWIYPVKSA